MKCQDAKTAENWIRHTQNNNCTNKDNPKNKEPKGKTTEKRTFVNPLWYSVCIQHSSKKL